MQKSIRIAIYLGAILLTLSGAFAQEPDAEDATWLSLAQPYIDPQGELLRSQTLIMIFNGQGAFLSSGFNTERWILDSGEPLFNGLVPQVALDFRLRAADAEGVYEALLGEEVVFAGTIEEVAGYLRTLAPGDAHLLRAAPLRLLNEGNFGFEDFTLYVETMRGFMIPTRIFSDVNARLGPDTGAEVAGILNQRTVALTPGQLMSAFDSDAEAIAPEEFGARFAAAFPQYAGALDSSRITPEGYFDDTGLRWGLVGLEGALRWAALDFGINASRVFSDSTVIWGQEPDCLLRAALPGNAGREVCLTQLTEQESDGTLTQALFLIELPTRIAFSGHWLFTFPDQSVVNACFNSQDFPAGAALVAANGWRGNPIFQEAIAPFNALEVDRAGAEAAILGNPAASAFIETLAQTVLEPADPASSLVERSCWAFAPAEAQSASG